MRRIRAVNQKADRIEEHLEQVRGASAGAGAEPAPRDVVALQQAPGQPQGPHIPFGCTLMFSPGWETDAAGGTAGLCQPVERDLFDCHLGCFWPAQVPDQLNTAPDWTGKCAAAQKDWRKIDLIFP
jgi:hypothetical protein